MITLKEAVEIASNFNKMSQIEQVLSRIHKVSEDGCRSMTISDPSEETINSLIDLGFGIKKSYFYHEHKKDFVINW